MALRREEGEEKRLGVLAVFSREGWPEGAREVWTDKSNAYWLHDDINRGWTISDGRPTDFQPTEHHRVLAAGFWSILGGEHRMVCPILIDG